MNCVTDDEAGRGVLPSIKEDLEIREVKAEEPSPVVIVVDVLSKVDAAEVVAVDGAASAAAAAMNERYCGPYFA